MEYFHVVFTIPHELGAIALQNKAAVYAILFAASARAMRDLAADPKHLGAGIGFLSVLHTWGQNLKHHPHVHCIVPGGGISIDGSSWKACRPGFFLPVRVLGRLFRGKFLHALRQAFEDGKLEFHGRLSHLADPTAFRAFLAPVYDVDWVVYAKPPFNGPVQALRYLARYTHRVAISNQRLIALEEGRVRFHWKDYRSGGRPRIMSLTAVEFLRRFLFHLLPRGFQRIRHYGFLANRHRRAKLARCRELIMATDPTECAVATDKNTPRCPECGGGRMVCVLVFAAWQRAPQLEDSS